MNSWALIYSSVLTSYKCLKSCVHSEESLAGSEVGRDGVRGILEKPCSEQEESEEKTICGKSVQWSRGAGSGCQPPTHIFHSPLGSQNKL
jgi:hypothetical protein